MGRYMVLPARPGPVPGGLHGETSMWSAFLCGLVATSSLVL
jgi:hypothetical protein